MQWMCTYGAEKAWGVFEFVKGSGHFVYLCLITNKKDFSPIILFQAYVFSVIACVEHSNFFSVKNPTHHVDQRMVCVAFEQIRRLWEAWPALCTLRRLLKKARPIFNRHSIINLYSNLISRQKGRQKLHGASDARTKVRPLSTES